MTAAPNPALRDLARLVADMRAAQKDYFRTRDARALQLARNAERRVDAAVDAALYPPQPTLFDTEADP